MAGWRKILLAAALGAAAMALVGGLGFASASILSTDDPTATDSTSNDCDSQYANDPSGVDNSEFCDWLAARNATVQTTTTGSSQGKVCTAAHPCSDPDCLQFHGPSECVPPETTTTTT